MNTFDLASAFKSFKSKRVYELKNSIFQSLKDDQTKKLEQVFLRKICCENLSLQLYQYENSFK